MSTANDEKEMRELWTLPAAITACGSWQESRKVDLGLGR
jgi:hypothetical protein